MKNQRYIFLFLVLFTFCFSSSQEKFKTSKQPKIGLVLSGGGAKGFAHIGVLKVIDSLGIKIDYVAGTSMGAIIGSLYASGYSGKQLETIFKKQDFEVLINDKYPRTAKSFFERESVEKYIASLPFDGFKINLPSALSRGQNVYNLLTELMLPVNHIRDFSKLPIPFFCVATNIETGMPEILDKGSLPISVTASGALPSLFQPVTINNKLYLDGGITDNFPVEELKKRAIDIVIGVDVQDGLRDRKELKTAPEILLQINNFRTIMAMKDKVGLVDVYLKPNVTDYTVVSFNDGEAIINEGEKIAIHYSEQLKQLKQEGVSKELNPVISLDSLKLSGIDIKGNESYTRSYLLGRLKLRGNEKIAYSDIKNGVDNLIATNNFEFFKYELIPDKDKQTYKLLGEVKETEAKMFLRLGVHYDGLYKGAALANITKKRVLFNNDIATLDIILGDNSRYNFEYFIDKGFYISLGINSRFNQFDKNVNPLLLLTPDSPLVDQLNSVEVQLEDFTNQVYMQTLFRRDFALRLGGEHKHLKIKSETLLSNTNSEALEFDNTNYFSLFGNLKYDSYSDRFFPKSGVYFNGVFNWYLGATKFNADNFNPFSIAKADIGYAFSVSDKVAFKLETNGGFKLGVSSINTLGFALGGYANNFINNFYSFYGYDYLDLTADSFVKATVTLDYEVLKKHHLIIAANYANIEDGLFDSGNWLSTPDFSGYALGYALETFVGPVEVKYTYSPEVKKNYWFFNVGFWF